MTELDFTIAIRKLLPFSIYSIETTGIQSNDLIVVLDSGRRFSLRLKELTPLRKVNEIGVCKTFMSIDPVTKQVMYKSKRVYETEKEAIRAAMEVNVKSETIHKKVAYKCPNCHKWHIGRNNTILTLEDKAKLKIKHGLK